MKESFSARNHQKKIFTNGISGLKSVIPTQFADLEAKARRVLNGDSFGYIFTGAGAGTTKDNNESSFKRWAIRPRIPNAVSKVDLSVKTSAFSLSNPVLLAPVGVLCLAHKEADLAVARAAHRMSTNYIFSNQASVPMEACAEAMKDKGCWFQLYHSDIPGLSESLINRAEAAGCEAIVITLDTTRLGWRPIDIDNAFLPFLEGRGLAQYTSDPVFLDFVKNSERDHSSTPPLRLKTIKHVIRLKKRLGRIAKSANLGKDGVFKIVQQFINHYSRPQLDWTELCRIKEKTSLPVFLKGILRAEDAVTAEQKGFDGLVISNHGGRQVAGSISSLDALVEIKSKVPSSFPLIVDSGIRTGDDIFKCLALGASSVAVGRPYVYALACAGEEGVVEYLSHLLTDLELTMSLSGCSTIPEISSEYVQRV